MTRSKGKLHNLKPDREIRSGRFRAGIVAAARQQYVLESDIINGGGLVIGDVVAAR